MASRELKVEIIGDASSLNKALGSVNKTSSKLGTSMKALGKVAAGAGLLIGAGFVATLKVGFEELAEGQKVMAQTEAVIKSTGGAANVSAKQMADYASSLSAVSGVDDEVIQSGENMLATFTNIRNETGKGNDIFKQATGTLLDMSTALGTDMNKSAIQLGKALNDPIKGITALQRVGVSFTEGQKETIKSMVETGNTMGAQKLILAELNKEFGGSAKAYGDTLPGALSKARNAFEEIAAHVAERFLPVLTKALNWVNSNWPQISKVVDQVADAIQNGLGQAVQTVRANFEAIKTVARTTFEGALTVVRKLVDFFKTDFGQSVAAGLGALLVMKAAMATLGVEIGNVGKALMLLGRNPFWALLIPVGLLVGELTKNYIKNKIAAAELAAATRDAGASMDQLRDSLNNLKQSAISEAQAKLNAEKATVAVVAAQKAYNNAVAEFGPKSAQAKAAHDALTQAKLDSRQADLDLKTSAEAHIQAELKRAQALNASTKTVMDLTNAAVKANGTFAQGETTNRYAAALRMLGTNAEMAAGKLRLTDPAASVAKQKAAALADVAADLAEKLDRVPTRKEIIAEAKARGIPKFYSEMDGIVTKMGDVAGKAYSEGVNIGQNLGYGALTGIVRAKLAVIQAAIQMVIDAAAAARGAAGIHSASTVFAEIGRNIVLGLAQGIGDNKEAKAKLKQLIGDPDILAKIGEASKTLGKTAVIEMIRGLVGLSPSFKAEAIKLIGDAMGGAKTEAATKAKEIADAIASARGNWGSAFASLMQAGLDAIDAKAAKWQPPSLLKAQRLAEERERAAVIQAVKDAAQAMQQAIADANAAAAAVGALEQRGPKEGQTQEEYNKELADAVAAANEKGAAIAAAQKTLDDAEFAKRQSDLAIKAKAETDAHNKEIASKKKHFKDRFNAIDTALKNEEITWETAQKRLLKLFGDYGIALGKRYAGGIKDGLAAVGSAVEELADAIAARINGKGGKGGGGGQGKARGGPVFKGGRYIVGEQGPEMFVPKTSGMIMTASQTRAFIKGQGKPPGTTSGKGTGGSANPIPPPKWAWPPLWDAAVGVASSIGKLEDFISAVDSGSFRANPGLLNGIAQNKSRWNWNILDGYPTIRDMIDMMLPLGQGLSGAEVAELFGIPAMKKGGILPGDGLYYGHKGEAVIPLDKGSMRPVTVVFNGPVLGTEEQLTRKIIEGIRREQTRGAPSIIRGR